MTNSTISINTTTSRSSECSRFASLVRELVVVPSNERLLLKGTLVKFLKFSSAADELIHELICICIGHHTPDRLDLAIDVLSQLGPIIQNYADAYLKKDIATWNKFEPNEKFKPCEDYWYILLRSAARCDADARISHDIISICQDEISRGIAEAVVEALGDLGSSDAKSLLSHISTTSSDDFIVQLAHEVLADLE